VGEAAEAAGLDEDASFHCRLAVDEACTNIIEHAYGGEDIGSIEITCKIEPGVCSIEIVDYGKPFNPDTVPTPDPAASLEELQPGGIGLHLMRQIMDTVEFRFGEGRNTLLMVKRRKDGAALPRHVGVPVEEVRSGVWIVMPKGRLDAATSPALEEALSDSLERGRIWLVIDMTKVDYVSSRGLKTLVSAWRKAGDAGGNLLLYGMTERVASIFETVGFSHIFDIYLSLDDALASIVSQGDK